MERVYILPDEFFGKTSAEVQVYFYQTNLSSQKNKVSFRQHLLCLLLEGHKEVFAGTGHVSFDSHSLLLMPAGNTLMSERTTNKKAYKSILLFFSDAFLADLIARNSMKPKRGSVSQDLFLFSNDPYIQNFEQSLQLLQEVLAKDSKLTRTKLEEILLYLFAKDPRTFLDFAGRAMQQNKDMHLMEVIYRQTDPNLSNEELAFLCHMSVSSFKRRFSEAFNTTPKQYFINKKMEKAASLLHQNKRPSEIYFELGYETQSAFSNEFKKHFGISPKDFR